MRDDNATGEPSKGRVLQFRARPEPRIEHEDAGADAGEFEFQIPADALLRLFLRNLYWARQAEYFGTILLQADDGSDPFKKTRALREAAATMANRSAAEIRAIAGQCPGVHVDDGYRQIFEQCLVDAPGAG